ncbi:hypothetical protein SAMN06269185_0036 [Natronoarchaeum philippinense]|uniref:DUF7321 domain-containing protein n=1 Tax=Natronoarchaeum philippinense TaxID=558529 RepID=A0A285MZ73_NATPI|nr:hypothetical protein [Natronoarchaeum philippinense]SNZ02494.1 hypothetical protein SAMN06269185_0036 [Natronoarchaeum philippinense]
MAEMLTAAIVVVLVTASFPLYLYGAWIIIEAETVTWDVLTHHLKFIGAGLALTTVPMVVWMIPRAFDQWGPMLAVHMFFGLQAYSLLLVALTGIVRIFQVKRRSDLYRDPDEDIEINDLHEHMGAWRWRLRIGVAGYLLFWVLAYLVGIIRFAFRYLMLARYLP